MLGVSDGNPDTMNDLFRTRLVSMGMMPMRYFSI
jgi:hypothetical protein